MGKIQFQCPDSVQEAIEDKLFRLKKAGNKEPVYKILTRVMEGWLAEEDLQRESRFLEAAAVFQRRANDGMKEAVWAIFKAAGDK